MPALASELRKQLEKTIVAARTAAEHGARQALDALAVGLREAHSSMSLEQKALRKKLRAHGRQLGDVLDSGKGTQAIARLVREVAYEHWHRMLFARFLAESGLLIEPNSKVAVTLAECDDLARERGVDPWVLAASYAESMLPQIFRSDDPALAVTLAPETRQGLERLLAALPAAVFTADDSLGWTYQFWQSAEKEAVNERVKSGEKISGETLPAVTQLFTEHYMVLFLLHNTLGAWHAGKVLASRPELARTATNEAELRDAVAEGLGGYGFDYLRFVREPGMGESEFGLWRPAAGTFESWPRTAAELTVLDPCCGSGHFLVAAFELLVRLRMKEEGLAIEAAIRAVIEQNLFGLELDARCTQIAAFNLALATWRWVGKPIELPRLNVACSGLGPASTVDEWVRLADDLPETTPADERARVRSSLKQLHGLSSQAPELGSLIDPSGIKETIDTVSFAKLRPLVDKILPAEQEDEVRERAVAASGMARAAEFLIGPKDGYTLVVTNVPYLGRKSHTDELKSWVDENYTYARNDLATVFVARMLCWVGKKGSVAAVTPQNWLFLDGSRGLREKLLSERTWNIVVRMGEHAFESSAAAGAFAAMLAISGRRPDEKHVMSGIDVSAPRGQQPIYAAKKAALLRSSSAPSLEVSASRDSRKHSVAEVLVDGEPNNIEEASATVFLAASADGAVRVIPQIQQFKNPDTRILIAPASMRATLLAAASVAEGTSRGDSERFDRYYWEIEEFDGDTWTPILNAPTATGCFGGRELVFMWERGKGTLTKTPSVRVRGTSAWGQRAVFVARSGVLRATLSVGEPHAQNGVAIVPKRFDDLPTIWKFCSSNRYKQEVSRLSAKVLTPTSALWSVPFDPEEWHSRALDYYPEGLPEPQSNDPSQWLFHGHPVGALASGSASRSPFGLADPVGADRHSSLVCREPNPRDVLQVAVARLLGYRWPAEQDESMRLDIAARAWVEKCRELDSFADADGIVCLASVRGEPSAADRVRKLLAAAFSDVPGGFAAARERELLAAAASDDRPAASLDEWLHRDFFAQHCELFHQRPFVWHVWDGRDDGFNALVNYHRLAGPEGGGRRTLELLAFTYLGEWIDRQRADQKEGKEGADGRVVAALRLQAELKNILEGEPPYDVFVRWKPLRRQPLGWDPDIDDGVRLNIRPFLLAADMGKKGAGVLRAKPNVKWTKDRGKEPESLRPRSEYPWFWGCDPEGKSAHRVDFGAATKDAAPAGGTFDGARWNELHYSRAAKEAARASLEVVADSTVDSPPGRSSVQKEFEDVREP